MSGRIAMIISLGSLLTCGTAFGASMCKIVPSCESLGYTMSESECATSVGYPITTLKCPFDNSMVYCPEDCLTYPIIGESCDQTKGNCVRCALSNRWKYLSCNLDEGYILEEGRCQPKPCDPSIYVYNDDNKPDTSKGRIVTCKSAGEMRYGYSECSEGWDLKGADCVDHECGEDYVIVGKTCTDGECITKCPDFGVCKDYCYSGTTEKVNFTCVEGLVRQGVKCVKHKVGSIAHYCSATDKIETKPELITNSCHAIGVVFYDNGIITKIMALHDIDQNSQPILKPNSGKSMPWSPQNSLCNDLSTGDADGRVNTKRVLDFANWHNDTDVPVCKPFAVRAGYRYKPQICDEENNCTDICPEGSICSQGNWYVPAAAEWKHIYDVYYLGAGTWMYEAFNSEANTAQGVIPFSTNNTYICSDGGGMYSTQISLTASSKQANWTYSWNYHYVRPILTIGD